MSALSDTRVEVKRSGLVWRVWVNSEAVSAARTQRGALRNAERLMNVTRAIAETRIAVARFDREADQ